VTLPGDRSSAASPRAYVPVAATGARLRLSFSRDEWARLAGLYGSIALLHIVGWGLYLAYGANHPALIGLGFAAYMLGLRHAFDADHIAAIDDTVRYMLQKGERPLAIGFFFSLGHSTIVLCLAIGVALAATLVSNELPELRSLGTVIGASVSGTFLWIIGVLNILVLFDILGVWKSARSGAHDHRHLEDLLSKRGLLNPIFGERLRKVLSASWQMYPLGLLFGLGFDTASEVGLLAMTAGASMGKLPVPAVLSLPILFAAGMTLMDTTDGVLMSKAYRWAFMNPLRRIFYNVATTSLSIAVALLIGTIELLQVMIHAFALKGSFFDFVAALDFGILGYVIVGMFLIAWGSSVAVWKLGRLEPRYGTGGALHLHPHTHADGTSHSHEHVH
jgi:high-affinity nickel-transport protein